MQSANIIARRFQELDSMVDRLLVKTESGSPAVLIESFVQWGASALNLLERIFGTESSHYQQFHLHYRQFEVAYVKSYRYCRAIFRAAKSDYEGGYLFNVRALVKAEVFDDTLEQANELLRAGYKDPACVVAGVTLESALKELCTHHAIPHAKLDKMNADLCKAGVYNMGWQKQITAWAERRNKAAHGEWTAYNDADVEDLINGTNRFIAEHL